MIKKRDVLIGSAFVASALALGLAAQLLEGVAAQDRTAIQAPKFEVDPLWPKPLPNNWVSAVRQSERRRNRRTVVRAGL
jgi:hypothetical protein